MKKAIVWLSVAWLSAKAAFAADPAAAGFEGARWIWYSQPADQESASADEGAFRFRGAFDVPAGETVASASVLVTADNLYTLYLNGQPVGQSRADPNAWGQPRRFDVTGRLVPGRNVLAVEAVNTAPGPGGLIVKLTVRLQNGATVDCATGTGWKAAEREEKNWTGPDFNDEPWAAAFVVGEYGVAPWGLFAPRAGEIPADPALPPGVPVTDWKKTLAGGGAARGVRTVEPPDDYPWPDAVLFLDDDCSLYRPPAGTGTSLDSLTVTIFNPRHSRAFPEHDLPAPMKVGRKLAVIRPARPGVEPRVLFDAGEGAIGSPSVTFDGRWILFSMAAADGAFFHIYKMPAAGGKPVRLTDGPFHDIDPTERPDGKLVFTSTRIGRFEEYHNPPSRSLFVMNADGTDIRPLTHTFIFDNEPEILADGRIVFIRSDNFFDRGKVETLLHAVHPDGTDGYTEFGLDLGPEYGNRLRAFHCGSPAPMPDGRLAFVSGPGITVGWPGTAERDQLHLRMEAGDVAALPDNRLLCTVGRRATREIVAKKKVRQVVDVSYEKIGVLDLHDRGAELVVLHESNGRPLHSPVFLGPHPRPPVLVERVDPRQADRPRQTGILYCQNVRNTKNTTAGWSHVRAVRVLAGRGLTMRSSHSYIVHAGSDVSDLGTVPVAPDGSFAVEVPADTAIAFQMVDAEGRSELNEMSWIYVRPGESRGCVGCHAARQSAPPAGAASMLGSRPKPLRLAGEGDPLRFRGNNAAVTGLMELQFDRYRETAGLNRHAGSADPAATGAQEVQALVRDLAGPDAARRASAANRLAVFRDPAAAPALAASLRDPDTAVRVAAAMALAACGTRDSAPPLLDALSDPEPYAAQAAAVALENLAGHAEPFDAFASAETRASQAAGWRAWFGAHPWDAIERDLVERLKGGDRDDMRRAAVALGHTGGDAARAALREVLARDRDVNPYPEWRKQHQGDGARFNAASPANPRALQAVARSIGYLKDEAAVPLLAETLNRHAHPVDGNLFLAEACAEALGRIGTPSAEAALVEAFGLLKDYWLYSGWYGDHGALIACHSSPVHYFILEALDALGSTNAAPVVAAAIRSVPTDFDRALMPANDDYETIAGRVIRRAGAEAAVVETCLSLLGDAAAARREDLAAALSKVHGAWGGTPDAANRAAQILSLVCRDRAYEPRIRAAFERSLAKPVDIPRVFDTGIPVVNKLPAKNWECFFLARAMGNLADPASADALIVALSQSPPEAASGRPDPQGPGVLFLHNDLTPCWRAEVAWALGRIGDRRATPVLLKIVGDLDNATDTRYEAAEALHRLATPADTDAIRKLAADYPEVSVRQALLQALSDR